MCSVIARLTSSGLFYFNPLSDMVGEELIQIRNISPKSRGVERGGGGGGGRKDISQII